MRELIVGASGLLGGHLLSTGKAAKHDVIGTYHHVEVPGLQKLDITDLEACRALMKEIRPVVVYLPAAIVNAEWVEQHPEASAHVNVNATLRFLHLVYEENAKVVYFSSDYVFAGREAPYTEEDIPTPVNEYGRQKVRVEEAIRKKYPAVLILRTTVVYGWEVQGKNFAMRCLRTLRAGESIRVPTDQENHPTYAPDLAIAARKLVYAGATGIFHIVGASCVSRYGFAQELAHAFSLPADHIVPVQSKELHQQAKRPTHVSLDTSKAERLFGVRLPDYRMGAMSMQRDEMQFLEIERDPL